VPRHDADEDHAVRMTKLAHKLKPVSSEVENALYEVRRKIYPRAVHGWFARWRLALVVITQVIFYGLPWLTWNGRQAVLFDLAERKFYIFGLVLWPQDFIFLTGLLVIAALSLFLFTALAGRLFCGYACPQSVYTEIFIRIERWIEGDRVQRMRLDREQTGPRKIALKSLKHLIWILLALWTGFTFVGYFTPIHTLIVKPISGTLGPWETFWTFFYAFATYGNAGWMREQVCKYMCPYARFQAVMFDPDTLVITYDQKRGEPRGARRRSVDARSAGLGDCVNCEICVQVCPTGIDIRDGLQYECTGCGACIDGCNQVMDKLGYARGLIRYSTENALRHGYGRAGILQRVLRVRTGIYASLLLVAALVLATGLYLRTPLKVDVIRDRAALARETREGLIENVYRLQIMNTQEQPRRFIISARGPETLTVSTKQPVEVRGASTESIPVALRVDPAAVRQGGYDVVFHIEAVDDAKVSTNEKSRFFVR
jgi:cytochrome c oxidase accessory protein FixG